MSAILESMLTAEQRQQACAADELQRAINLIRRVPLRHPRDLLALLSPLIARLQTEFPDHSTTAAFDALVAGEILLEEVDAPTPPVTGEQYADWLAELDDDERRRA